MQCKQVKVINAEPDTYPYCQQIEAP